MICKALGTPDIDLFASRMSHKLPMHISQKPNLFSTGVDAFQQSCRNVKSYAVPPFCLIRKILRKAQIDMATIILITPACQSQAQYSKAPQMSIRNLVLILRTEDLLQNPNTQQHPLVTKHRSQWLGQFPGKAFYRTTRTGYLAPVRCQIEGYS